jgi:hypothetical protein
VCRAYGGDVTTSVGHLGPMPLIATLSASLSQQAINDVQPASSS